MTSCIEKSYLHLVLIAALTNVLVLPVKSSGQQLKGAVASVAKPSLSPPLTEIKPKRLEFKGARQQLEVKKLPPLESKGRVEDHSLQTKADTPAAFEIVKSIRGLGSSDNKGNLVPPDSTGAAGSTQYVQWVNQTMTVFGKDGSVQFAAADGNTLWKGFGGPCEELNDGDPIVLFDRLKDKNNTDGRWILAQFAVLAGPPYFECVAVSQTADAKGRYYRYAFQFDLFNDYPKLGVWPDAYYASFNKFKDLGTKDKDGNEQYEYKQPRVCALEREKMIQGLDAHMQCFDTTSRSMLPADLDGSLAPAAGSPGLFMDYTIGAVRIWQMKVDWKNEKLTTLSAPAEIQVEPFAEPCVSEGCIPQPQSTESLDASGDRLMFRLSYRRFAGASPHEVLLANHTVRVDSQDKKSTVPWIAAVRWYELDRSDGKRWELKQQGTYAPDLLTSSPSSRWAGSIAMDKYGNILVGYSKSSKDVFPGIFAAGRSAKDAAPELQKEVEVHAGQGSVLPSGNDPLYRWGDYSTMTLDPDDDCTFWFTSEYQDKSASYAWQTQITSLRFTPTSKDPHEQKGSNNDKAKAVKP